MFPRQRLRLTPLGLVWPSTPGLGTSWGLRGVIHPPDNNTVVVYTISAIDYETKKETTMLVIHCLLVSGCNI